MKKLIHIIMLCAGILTSASAQTFTQRIQQKVSGMGTVTIHESDSIDQLVNSATLGNTAAKQATAGNRVTPAAPATANPHATATTTPKPVADDDTEEKDDAPVEITKKMLVGGYKVQGYRVQAFAGGNSRKDRQKAERIGNDIKASFPDEPVYVHFYSPRWICRVGNYRTYEEAHQMLVSLRKMGFTQSTIVKGKITVTD